MDQETLSPDFYERLDREEVSLAELETRTGRRHWSDCALHGPPALPARPCSCGHRPEAPPAISGN
jgi:hypothetical protein